MNIKSYLYAIIAIVVVVLLFSFSYLISENIKLKKENDIKTENIISLNSKIFKFKTTDSLNAAKIQSFTYTADEFKTFRQKDMETIQSLKLKLKNVKSVTNIETVTKDSFITKIIVKDSLKCFDFKDDFTNINGCIKDSLINVNYKITDKLTAVITTRYKHNFLFFHWGYKIDDLTVKSKNPKTNIDKIDYVIIKK